MNENVILEARIKFGLLFKEIRVAKKLTQTQVAEFCGVTFQTINKVEKGKFPYSVDLLMKLSVVLGFTINFDLRVKTVFIALHGRHPKRVLNRCENDLLLDVLLVRKGINDQQDFFVCHGNILQKLIVKLRRQSRLLNHVKRNSEGQTILDQDQVMAINALNQRLESAAAFKRP